MATSISNTPNLNYLADRAIVAAGPELHKLADFATDFSADTVARARTKISVAVYDGGTASNFDRESNNFGTIDGTITYAEVELSDVPKCTFAVNDTELDAVPSEGNTWGKMGKAAGRAIAKKAEELVADEIDYTTVSATATMATTTLENLAKLRVACANKGIAPQDSVVMLIPSEYATALSLLPAGTYDGPEAIREGRVPGAFGFKSIQENAYLSEATTSAVATGNIGAIVPEDALIFASRTLACGNPACYTAVESTTDEESGLTLQTRIFGDPKTGDNFVSVNTVFGATLTEPDKVIRIVKS